MHTHVHIIPATVLIFQTFNCIDCNIFMVISFNIWSFDVILDCNYVPYNMINFLMGVAKSFATEQFRSEIQQCNGFHQNVMTSSNGNFFCVTSPLEIHWSPVNSSHKSQWRGALMFSFICTWINGWVNNREAGDLRLHRAHYNVIVVKIKDRVYGEWKYSYVSFKAIPEVKIK